MTARWPGPCSCTCRAARSSTERCKASLQPCRPVVGSCGTRPSPQTTSTRAPTPKVPDSRRLSSAPSAARRACASSSSYPCSRMCCGGGTPAIFRSGAGPRGRRGRPRRSCPAARRRCCTCFASPRARRCRARSAQTSSASRQPLRIGRATRPHGPGAAVRTPQPQRP